VGELGGMQTVKAGVIYFVLVFSAGFVLGAIRTMWLAPRLGTRMAALWDRIWDPATKVTHAADHSFPSLLSSPSGEAE
jgi:hypothetical protein